MFKYTITVLVLFGAFCFVSNDDFKKQDEPKKVESTQDFIVRIDKVKEHVMQKHMEELLSLEKIK